MQTTILNVGKRNSTVSVANYFNSAVLLIVPITDIPVTKLVYVFVHGHVC